MTVGTNGNDTLTGTAGADLLQGLAGNDMLIGDAGVDQTEGGTGDDTHIVDRSTDVAIELAGEGTDTVQSSASYSLGANIERLVLSGTAAINGTGNDLANVIIGNSAANILNGAVGADQMRGGGGDDTYVVDNVADKIFEISPADGFDHVKSSVSFSLGSYLEKLTLTGAGATNGTGNSLDNVILGNAAANVLIGGGGADQMRGGGGDDTYVVDNVADKIFEISPADGFDHVKSSISFSLGSYLEKLTLTGAGAINGTGNSLDNILIGNAAANVLIGGGGADQMRGGGGDDTYVVDNAGDQIFEISPTHGIDLVKSSVSFSLGSYLEKLTLTGAGAIDGTGNSLDNILIGNAAANVLNGGGGADQMRGGGGDDTYVVNDAGDQIFEISPTHGIDLVNSSVSFSLGSYLENLNLTGGAAIDGNGNTLANIIVGNSAANVLNGGGGADTMRGGAGGDTYIVDNLGDQVVEESGGGIDLVRSSVSFVLGSNLENLILTGVAPINATGNALANQITGNAATNLLDGGIGADTMTGGAGNDIYEADNVGDLIVEAAGGGTDLVRSTVSHTLAANVENLLLTGSGSTDGTGNSLANEITGNAGDNALDGGAGADTLEGGNGDDSYVIDNAGDLVVESSAAGGSDWVNSSIGYTLGANLENLSLTGGGAIDGIGNGLANIMTGNGGANLLDGSAGNDALQGMGGNDVLNGGTGQDELTGGTGSDIFEFTAALGAGNLDMVADFDVAEDTIRLGGGAGQPFVQMATGALWEGSFRIGTAATDAFHRIIYNSATGALLYDADGLGGVAAVQFATLDAGLAVSAADFVVSGPANIVPQIVSGETATVDENVPTSTIIYQTEVQDADGDKLVFQLLGADAELFTIDQTGAVRFVASPNFEVRDSYFVVVEVLDSAGMGDGQGVWITITDVDEIGDPYLVNETAAANDTRFSAQPLNRNLFTVADSPNVPDDSLPTAIITGNVSAPGDKDFFSITLEAGELLVLDIDGTDTLDAWVTVYDASGNIITFNDDPGGPFDPGSIPHPGVAHNMDSFIRVRAPTDGTYFISVESFFDQSGPSSDGEYTLNVSIGPVATPEEINQENIQALISGDVWPDPDLTYGFTEDEFDYGPGEGVEELEAGMTQLNGTQRAAVNTILAQYANLTNLTFTQLSANPGAAQLRYALSNEPETAHAYYPGPGDGGDSWYNTTEYTSPSVGNYEWMAFVHETGHALGLKHGHESPALSPDRDSLEFSVMTYRGHIGAPVDELNGGYTNETWGFPQTLMMYDIAALQQMYGADFGFNSGNTTYSWSPTTGAFLINGAVQWTPGANRIFMTLWDGGGTDTYDFSGYASAVQIDLRPGQWVVTNDVQLANLGDGYQARGNIANALLHNDDPRSLIENAIGGSAKDVITANQAVNHLTGNGNNDTFRWMSIGDSLPGSADVMMDFVRGADKIDLSAIDARDGFGDDNPFQFIGTAAFGSAPDGFGQLRYDVVGGNVHVFGDVNADGVADFQLILNNLTTLSSSDFILI